MQLILALVVGLIAFLALRLFGRSGSSGGIGFSAPAPAPQVLIVPQGGGASVPATPPPAGAAPPPSVFAPSGNRVVTVDSSALPGGAGGSGVPIKFEIDDSNKAVRMKIGILGWQDVPQ